MGWGRNRVSWLMSLERRMQRKRPSTRWLVPSSSIPSVLMSTAMLWVLQETIWRKRSSPCTSASSLTPLAYILPNPNSDPWAMKPIGPDAAS